MPPAVYRDCDESRVTCMKNYERWLCYKYDVNYLIMQSNMTMMKHVDNEIELGIEIPTIESRASNRPMTKGTTYVVMRPDR